MTREEIDRYKAELRPIIEDFRNWLGNERANNHFKALLEHDDMYNEETKEIFGI